MPFLIICENRKDGHTGDDSLHRISLVPSFLDAGARVQHYLQTQRNCRVIMSEVVSSFDVDGDGAVTADILSRNIVPEPVNVFPINLS